MKTVKIKLREEKKRERRKKPKKFYLSKNKDKNN
jgi:hypothetical protein